ncbi:hypothetical protein K438DRAFT_1781838 [Mycena galopus ATCC 62051]|nr:hypothetical protein K438DRAFT_1781838 [Mycena galopus ATCC 62051]
MANTIPLDDTTSAHDQSSTSGVGKIKRSSAWFFLICYVALLSNIALASTGGADHFQICKKALRGRKLPVGDALSTWWSRLNDFATLAVRVCAMHGFSRRVFTALVVAAAITVSLGAISTTAAWESTYALLAVLSWRLSTLNYTDLVATSSSWASRFGERTRTIEPIDGSGREWQAIIMTRDDVSSQDGEYIHAIHGLDHIHVHWGPRDGMRHPNKISDDPWEIIGE